MAELERLEAEVSADAGSAIGEIKAFDKAADSAAKDREAEIKIKADKRGIDQARDALGRFTAQADKAGGGGGGGGLGKLTSHMGQFNIKAKFMQNMVKLIKWPVLISGAQAATAGIIALGGAVVGLTSALRPLAGALAALPQGFSLLASVMGTAKLGMFGIGAATKAYKAASTGASAAADKQTGATKKVTGATRQLEDATRSIADALEDVTKAEEDVTKATQELTEAQGKLDELLTGATFAADLAEQERDAERASMGLTRAQESLADAQQRLNEAMNPAPADALDLRDAELDLAEAQANLNALREEGAIDVSAMQKAERELGMELDDQSELFRKATATAEQLARAELTVAQSTAKLADLQGKGVPDAEKVADAQRDVRDAAFSVTDAELEQVKTLAELNKMQREGIEGSKDVINAREDVADAGEGLVTANERLHDSHIRVTDAERDLLDVQVALKEAQEDLKTAATSAGSGADTLRDALAELSPKGRIFAKFIQDELVPRLKELRTVAQENLLPGLQQGITNALPLFPHLKTAIGDMAKEMGTVATNVGTMMGSDFFTGAFDRIMQSNAGIMRDSIGPALQNFIGGLMNLMDAARPLTEHLGKLLLKLSEIFSVWAANKNAMDDPFGETITVVDKLVKIFGNLWSGLGNVMDAAKPLGTWILDSIVKVTDKFKQWTGETENAKKMTDFFEALKEPLAAAAKLLGDVVSAIFRVGAGTPEDGFKGFDALTETLTKINEQVPKLEEFFKGVRESKFLDTFIGALGDWLPVLSALFGPSGPLTVAVGIFGEVGKVLAKVIEVVGPGNVAAMAMFSGTIGGLGLAGGLAKKGITRLFGPFKKLGEATGIFKKKGALLNCTDAVTCTDTTTGKVNGLKTTMGKLGDKAKTLGAKMKTAFTGIVGGATKMGGKVGPAVSKLGPIISKALMSVGSMIGSVAGLMIPWGLIIAAALLLGVVLWKNKDKILEFFAKLPGILMDFFSGAGEWLVDAGKKILEGAFAGLEWMFRHSYPVIFWTYKDEILGFFKKAIDWLFDVGKDILEGMWKGIKWMFAHSYPVIFWTYKDEILGFFSKALTWLFDAGKSILEGMWKGIQWIWDHVIVGAFNIAKWLGDKFVGAAKWLFDIGKDILDGLWKGIVWIWDHTIKGLFNIKDWIFDALESVGKAGKWLLDFGKDLVKGLWDGVWEKKDWFIEKIKEFFGKIPVIGGLVMKLFSPSRVMADMGKNIVLGLAQGITKNEDMVAKAARGMFNQVNGEALTDLNFAKSLAPLSGGALSVGGITLKIEVNGSGSPEATASAVTKAGQDLIPELLRELRSR